MDVQKYQTNCGYINDVPMVMVLLSYFSRYGTWRTDVRTESQVTTKTFVIDGLPNLLREGAQLAHLQRAGTPLSQADDEPFYPADVTRIVKRAITFHHFLFILFMQFCKKKNLT